MSNNKQQQGQYFQDPSTGEIVFVRNPLPEDKGNFWGHPTPNGPLARATQGGKPDIYDEDYYDYYSNNLMFVQTGPEFMPDPGKRDDLGGRDHWNPAAKRRNQGLIPKDQQQLDQLITPTDITLPGETGQLVEIVGDAWNAFAKKNTRRDSQLVAYASTDSPDMTTYFSQLGFDPTAPSPLRQPLNSITPPFGGAILVGELSIGHQGVNQPVLFDIPAAQLVKITFNGTSGQLRARLWPKYYFPDDTVAGLRTYSIGDILNPEHVPLTNINYNNPVPRQMAINGFSNVNPARVRGWIAEGSNATDVAGRATRSFSGSVKAGAAAANFTKCPIAWYCNAVQLRGGALVAGAAETVKFLITDFQGITSGPYPANQIIPISNSIESIQVYSDSGNTVETPFELVYYISI